MILGVSRERVNLLEVTGYPANTPSPVNFKCGTPLAIQGHCDRKSSK